MLIVGLTGGVASGKSAVSKCLRKEGAYIIDADQISRELVRPSEPVWKELVSAFGNEILDQDGGIHRKKLAAIVFSDRRKRDLLNRIIHPRIRQEIDRRKEGIGRQDPAAIIVIDGALLVELGQHREMDKLIVVTSKESQQIERLKEREGISEEEARRIVSSQMPAEEKVRVADFVIPNEGSLEETERVAREVFQKLKKIALRKDERRKSAGSP